MIYHNINPVLFQIGSLQIRYYGFVYVFGILLAYFILKRLAKRNQIKGLTLANLDDLILYLEVGLIVGARLLDFVFYNPSLLIQDPLEVFRIWHGGMSFHGGLIGVITGAMLFCRKYKVKFYDIADALIIPTALILFIGRIVNFINGELIGTVTDLPFCVQYQNVEGCRHPSQIYEALKNLLIFFILIAVRKKRQLKSGMLFWLFVFMYGVLRFIVNFLRDDPRFLGISVGQYLSLTMAIVAAIFLYRLRKK